MEPRHKLKGNSGEKFVMQAAISSRLNPTHNPPTWVKELCVIEVPKSWDDCVKIYKENDNTLWQDAVRKEMKNVRIAFTILNGEESVPPSYQ
jgi:hypothetical protein